MEAAKPVLKIENPHDSNVEDQPIQTYRKYIIPEYKIQKIPLPDTMEITIVAFIKMPDGPSAEPGLLHVHHVYETKMTVKPTTTVGEMKDFVLKIMPILEYNRIEIAYQDENLPDRMNVKQIDYRGPFVTDKTLHMLIFSRNRTYKDMYKYFINAGENPENAKKQTEKIMHNRIGKPTKMKICNAEYPELIELFPVFLP